MLFKLYSDDNSYFLVLNYKYIRVIHPTLLEVCIKHLTLKRSYITQTLTKDPKNYGWLFIEDITPESHPELFI